MARHWDGVPLTFSPYPRFRRSLIRGTATTSHMMGIRAMRSLISLQSANYHGLKLSSLFSLISYSIPKSCNGCGFTVQFRLQGITEFTD
jgi:hypothetical protein